MQLNDKIWQDENKLIPEIRERLIIIARTFLKTLNAPVVEKAIYLTGSLASYQWRPMSDFDIHCLVEITDDECKGFLDDYFDTRAKLFNANHSIFIKGYKVEMNVKEGEVLLEGKGVFDLGRNKWIQKPSEPKRELDDDEVLRKTQEIQNEIDELINTGDVTAYSVIRDKIKAMRTEGLTTEGEYGIGNLVFKALRHSGYLDKLFSKKAELEDEIMSMEKVENVSSFKNFFETAL